MTNSKAKILFWAAVLLVVAGAAAAVTVSLRKSDTAEGALTSTAASTGRVAFLMEQQWLIRLKLAKVEQARMSPQVRSTGRVVPVPAKRAVVSPPVSGIIQAGTMPTIGQHVRQGQTLASLRQTLSAAESTQIHLESARADAERRRLAQAEIEAQARLEEATHDLGRSKRLFEKRAYSAKALETDELARTAAAAQLEAIREQLKALQATPETGIYELLAPISGTIVNVNKTSGEQVSAGEPVMEIVALDTVWVEAPVFEESLGKLSRDLRGVFTTAAFPDREFQGRLVHIGKIVDEHTRVASVIFEVPNPSEVLSIGMQANIRLDAGPQTDVLLVPKEAVLDNEGKKIVYVLISGEEFERREVVPGDEYGGMVAIVSGVKAGERVVTQGAYQLKLQELRPADAGAHTHEI
jgi:membrane fusion protein, heavy metal efflux system